MLKVKLMTVNYLVFYLIACLLFVFGCSRPAAIVNGKKIDRELFEIRLKEKISEHEDRKLSPDTEKLKDAVMQAMIGEAIMIREAELKGITVSDKDLTDVLESMKQNAGEEAFMKGLKDKDITLDVFRKRTWEEMMMLRFTETFFKEVSVSDKEAEEFYQKSPRPFIKAGRVFMKIIEVPSEEAARTLEEEMTIKKIDFDDIAKGLSDQNQAIVSDYGWVNPDFFSASISQAVKDLKPGESGGPYQGQKGYFFIKVKDREKEQVARFEEVKDEIVTALLEQKKQARLAHWLAQKKKTASIEININ
jgi:parvulin-like peptidyl-prolyl isomerase